jgi:hypothetical protein
VLWCDSYYYIFYCVQISLDKEFKLVSGSVKGFFPHFESGLVDVVVFHFCLAVDDDALCLFVVNQHGDVLVAFDVSGFSAGGDGAYYDLTVNVSVIDRNGVYSSILVVGANPCCIVSFKQRFDLFTGEGWWLTSIQQSLSPLYSSSVSVLLLMLLSTVAGLT